MIPPINKKSGTTLNSFIDQSSTCTGLTMQQKIDARVGKLKRQAKSMNPTARKLDYNDDKSDISRPDPSAQKEKVFN